MEVSPFGNLRVPRGPTFLRCARLERRAVIEETLAQVALREGRVHDADLHRALARMMMQEWAVLWGTVLYDPRDRSWA